MNFNPRIAVDLPPEEVRAFCEKWSVRELALFGSIVGGSFGNESDVDVLVTFAQDVQRGLFDLVEMQRELEHLLGRQVDLLTREGVERSSNHLHRKAILDSAQVIYAAA